MKNDITKNAALIGELESQDSIAVYRLPLNFDGYFVPKTVTRSGENEIYLNSRMSKRKQRATVRRLTRKALYSGDQSLACKRIPEATA